MDDDVYFLQSTKERLLDQDFDALTASSLTGAKKIISEHPDAAAVVIDIMMPSDGESDIETQMGFKSGVVLARWVKQHYPRITIVGISGASSLDTNKWFVDQGMPFFEKGSLDFIEGLNGILGIGRGERPIRSFIVHGHDDSAKYALKNYLQNILGLPEPVILHEQPSLGRTIIEKFEDVSRQVDLVFVLLTPDDKEPYEASSNDSRRRARQNVIFEMGYFFGRLQRRKGRVILLYTGPLDLPSDISGIAYIDISNGLEGAGETIRKELADILK